MKTEIMAFVSVMILGALIGFSIAQVINRHEALKHHAGHYVCDPNSGATWFEWNNK